MFVSGSVFPYLSQNSDEGAYLAQASALRSGQLVPLAPDHFADRFLPWFAVLRDGHFVYKYAPVHAALLAAVPDLLGGPRLALGLIAAAAAVLTVMLARELGVGRRGAWVAGAVFVCSPVVVVQSGTFLPYLGNLTLLLAFAVATRRGARTGSTPLLVTGGLMLGIAFWARPYDAVLFAAPLLVWQAVRCHHRADPVGLGRFLTVVGLGAVPGLLAFLGYNALTTGSPLRLPFRLQEQADNLGFGERRTNRLEPFFDYTAKAAWRATSENARLLLTWSFGSVMLLVLGIYGTFLRPLARARWLLAAWFVVWPCGFFFFWGSFSYIFRWDGGRYLGPYYYLPMLVPLAIGAGFGIQRIWDHVQARWVIGVFVLAAVVLVTPQFGNALDDNRARTEHRRLVAAAVDDAVQAVGRSDDGVLIFLPGVWGPNLQHPFSFLRNAPGYDGGRVYALDGGNRDLALQREYPDRTVLAVSLPDGYIDGATGVDAPVWVEEQSVVRGAAVEGGIDRLRAEASLALRFELGGRRLDVPVDADGRARAVLEARGDALTISAPGTGASFTVTPAADSMLQVSIVRPVDGGGTQTLEQRDVPVAVSDAEVSVMWPGTVSSSVLSPGGRSRWSAQEIAS